MIIFNNEDVSIFEKKFGNGYLGPIQIKKKSLIQDFFFFKSMLRIG